MSEVADTAEYLTIWLRRLDTSRARTDTSRDEQELCREESRAITGAAICYYADFADSRARIIDRPMNVLRAEHKALQLSLASRLGIDVPESRITNDADEVRNLKERYDTLVAKPLSGRTAISPFVEVLDEGLIEYVSPSPVLVQRHIPPAADIRILICGRDALVWRRDVGTDEGVDWRRCDPHGQQFRPVEPVPEIVHKAIELVGALGLSTSVQDWVLDRDGRYWFLESNPQGAWLFLPCAEEVAVPFYSAHLLGEQ